MTVAVGVTICVHICHCHVQIARKCLTEFDLSCKMSGQFEIKNRATTFQKLPLLTFTSAALLVEGTSDIVPIDMTTTNCYLFLNCIWVISIQLPKNSKRIATKCRKDINL